MTEPTIICPNCRTEIKLTEPLIASTQPWRYLLIPHDQVTEDKRLMDYLAFAQT